MGDERPADPPAILLGGALLLSSRLGCSNAADLEALEVDCVVNVAVELHGMKYAPCVKSVRLLSLVDDPDVEEREEWLRAVDAVSDARSRHSHVLVHCQAGKSRSSSVVLGYMVKHLGMPLTSAWDEVSRARPLIWPHRGYVKYLNELEVQRDPSAQQFSPELYRVRSLVEMGFKELDAVMAMRGAHGDLNLAIQRLMQMQK